MDDTLYYPDARAIMTALAIFGGLELNPNVLVHVLMLQPDDGVKKFQQDLGAAFFYSANHRIPANKEELEKAHVMFKEVQHKLRARTQTMFDKLAEMGTEMVAGIPPRYRRHGPDRARRIDPALRQQLRDTQKPSEHGTVAEIATRYGISKSEVRRLKASGELDAFIQTAGAPDA